MLDFQLFLIWGVEAVVCWMHVKRNVSVQTQKNYIFYSLVRICFKKLLKIILKIQSKIKKL